MARGLHVVAGTAKGVPLVAPKGARPTTGRVREAVFSSLGDLTDAAVLDLFAGSGALGIEALSRGAARAVFVERERAGVQAIETNLESAGVSDRSRVVRAAVSTALRGAPPVEAPFDLVLADPPYDADDRVLVDVLDALAAPGWLPDDGRVVLELSTRRPAPEEPSRSIWPSAWVVGWERRYGDTLVVVLRRST